MFLGTKSQQNPTVSQQCCCSFSHKSQQNPTVSQQFVVVILFLISVQLSFDIIWSKE